MIPLPKKVKLEQVQQNEPSPMYYTMQAPAQQMPLQQGFYGLPMRTMLESLSEVATQSVMQPQSNVTQQATATQSAAQRSFYTQNQMPQLISSVQNPLLQRHIEVPGVLIKKEPTNQQFSGEIATTTQQIPRQFLAATIIQQNHSLNQRQFKRDDFNHLLEEKKKLWIDQKFIFNAYFTDKHLVMTTIIPKHEAELSVDFHFIAARCTICDELSADEFIDVARKLSNSQFESRKMRAIKIFLPELQVHAIFHQSGKLIVKCCKSEREALVAARACAKRIRDVMTDKSKVFFKQFRVTDVKATCGLGFYVDVTKFHEIMSRGSEYDEDKGFVIYRRYVEVLGQDNTHDESLQSKKKPKTGPSVIIYHTGTLKMNGFTSCLDVIKLIHLIYDDLIKSKSENCHGFDTEIKKEHDEYSEDEYSDDSSENSRE